MKSIALRIFGPLIALVTGWPISDPDSDVPDAGQPTQADEPSPQRSAAQSPAADGKPSRLSPGAAEAQAALVRRQLAQDAVQQALARHPAVRRQRSARQASRHEGQRADYSHRRTVGGTRRDIPWYEKDDGRERREAELEARRARQARREAEAAASGQHESRLSADAVEAQAALVREQLQRDAEARAQARPTRQSLRNRTRMGPLQGIARAQARLPQHDVRVDDLVTAGIITAAVTIGALSRLGDGAWLVAILGAAAAVLVILLVFDYRRWHGSFPARATRIGAVAGLVFFLGFTFIGRVGELVPVPLPDDCSIDSLRAHYAKQHSTTTRYATDIERLTGRLRRPAALESDSERAPIFVSRGLRRLNLGDPEQALADFQRGLELDSDQIWAYVLRADLFEAASCPQHAHGDRAAIQRIYASSDDGQALSAAVHQFSAFASPRRRPPRRAGEWDLPSSPHGINMVQGIALAQLGRWPEAIEQLTYVSKHEWRDADARFFRGLIHLRLGDLPAALEDFKFAIAVQPNWAAPEAAAGQMLVRQWQVHTGLADLNAAVRLDPASWNARQWRGQALLESGEADAGRADFEHAILIQVDAPFGPDFADPYVGLAAAELALGNRQRAALALAEARLRPVSWINEPTITAWLQDLERELGSPAAI